MARKASRQRVVSNRHSRVLAPPPIIAKLTNHRTQEPLTSKMGSVGHRSVARLFKPAMLCLSESVLEPQYEKVGSITHFYSKPSVAVIELSASLNKGDKIVIRGSTTNIEQTVDSMEIEHKQIPNAEAGQSIGMKVLGRVRENDVVYKVKSSA